MLRRQESVKIRDRISIRSFYVTYIPPNDIYIDIENGFYLNLIDLRNIWHPPLEVLGLGNIPIREKKTKLAMERIASLRNLKILETKLMGFIQCVVLHSFHRSPLSEVLLTLSLLGGTNNPRVIYLLSKSVQYNTV